ncbi:MAG: peptide deformylase [Bacteroidales bacterium]|jgi:peptide deformylase|nr:peptide deformylase [Bacteroidales bacterium]
MIQPIYLYGSKVLRERAAEVDLNDKEGLKALVQDLRDTLAHADGVGLAAPQIGVGKRVVIVDGVPVSDTYDYLKDFRRVLVNPVIVDKSEQMVSYQEGCLSIPGIFCDVVRPKSITVEYFDENLTKITETFDNFAARMVEHELSHLDGDMFTDHVSPIRKKIITKKLQSISRGRASAHYKTKLI